MSADEVRAALRHQWSAASRGWEQHAAVVDEHTAPVARAMLERAAPAAGERVLELACGPGGVGLAAAPLVGDTGEVVVSDVVPQMVAIARARAAAAGLANVRTRELDLEAVDEPDSSYDVVLCRYGLMLVVDPAGAAREIARVLHRDGRAAIAVWGPQEANPWLGILFDAVSDHLGAPIPPPGAPGPFALDEPARLEQLLSRAGLSDVAVEEVPAPMRLRSGQQWWEVVPALAGPLVQLLASLPDEGLEAIRARAGDALEAHARDGGLDLPGVALVASGRG